MTGEFEALRRRITAEKRSAAVRKAWVTRRTKKDTKMKIVWREWYSSTTVASLTKMGTLPREETEIPIDAGHTAVFTVRELVRRLNEQDAEFLRKGGRLVILEPEEYAGVYNIAVDYEPTFHVSKSNET